MLSYLIKFYTLKQKQQIEYTKMPNSGIQCYTIL